MPLFEYVHSMWYVQGLCYTQRYAVILGRWQRQEGLKQVAGLPGGQGPLVEGVEDLVVSAEFAEAVERG